MEDGANLNLNIIDPNADLNDVAKSMGIDLPVDVLENKGIANTGFTFFQHKPGNYVGLLSMLGDPVFVKEVEGKKKKFNKPEPGAIKSYCMLPIMLVEDPDGKLIDDSFTPLPGITYGRIVWQQYISLLGERQFGNKRLFGQLKYKNLPQLNIVQGTDTDYSIKLELLKHFYFGAPVTFTLDKIAGSKNVWMVEDSLQLRKPELTKEMIEKRKIIGNSLWQKIWAIKEAEEAERKAKKAETSAEGMSPELPESDVTSPDSLLNNSGYEL